MMYSFPFIVFVTVQTCYFSYYSLLDKYVLPFILFVTNTLQACSPFILFWPFFDCFFEIYYVFWPAWWSDNILNASDDEKIKRCNTFGNAEEVQLGTPSQHSKDVLDGSEATSKNTLYSTVVDPPLR